MNPKFKKSLRNKALRQSHKVISGGSWRGSDYFSVRGVDILEGYKPRKDDREINLPAAGVEMLDTMASKYDDNYKQVERQVVVNNNGHQYYDLSTANGKTLAQVNKDMHDFIQNLFPLSDAYKNPLDKYSPILYRLRGETVAILMPVRP